MHMVTPAVTPADRSISPSRITNTSAMPSITRVAAWVIRLAKLRSVRKNGLSTENSDAQHDESGDRGQGAHVAAAHALEPGAHLIDQAALLAASDQVVADLGGRHVAGGVGGDPRAAHAFAPVRVLVPVM